MGVPIAKRAVAAIDKRIGLPFPKWPEARYALYVALPAFLALRPMFLEYGVKLGVLALPLAVIAFFVIEGLLWHVLTLLSGRWWPRVGARRSIVLGLVGVALAALGVGSGFLYERWAPASVIATESTVVAHGAEWLRTLTDVDRDGISSVFGGNDCAAWDGSRSPSQRDVPGNGIDEDCDGQDAAETAVLTDLTAFHGKLSRTQQQQFNVLWLVIDSLRADHVSAHGYKHKTTPHLDELARESWMFTQAYAQSSTTALSMPSMFAGRRPASMKWLGGYPRFADSERMLPKVMQERGWVTTLSINRYVKRRLTALQKPFQHVATVPKGVDWKSGEYIISNVIRGIEHARKVGKPFFIAAHFDDVHHPYRAFRGRSVPTFSDDDKDRGNYDRCIANLDNMLRPLMSHIRHLGIWDKTILIITSDHGEEFKEHGKTIHSQACYVESTHVPLIVRVPGFQPKRIKHRVALVDLVPTIVEAVGLPRDGWQLDGQSLFVPVLAPELVHKDRPIFCSIFQLLSGRKNFFTRSVRTDAFSLVYETLGDHAELYDLKRDPRERKDVAKQNPERTAELKEMLKASLTGNLWQARRFK